MGELSVRPLWAAVLVAVTVTAASCSGGSAVVSVSVPAGGAVAVGTPDGGATAAGGGAPSGTSADGSGPSPTGSGGPLDRALAGAGSGTAAGAGTLPTAFIVPAANLPTIQQRPVEAAVMLVQQDTTTVDQGTQLTGSLTVVAADGSGYRRVPGVTGDMLFAPISPWSALSPDGRRLLWGSPDDPGPLTAHVLTLATGTTRDLTIPRAGSNTDATDVFWTSDGNLVVRGVDAPLYDQTPVLGMPFPKLRATLRTVDVTSGALGPVRTWPAGVLPVDVRPDGVVVTEAGSRPAAGTVALPRFTAAMVDTNRGTGDSGPSYVRSAFAADGHAWVSWVSDLVGGTQTASVVDGSGLHQLSMTVPAGIGQITWQAWRPGGIYGWADHSDDVVALVRLDPATGRVTVVSTGAAGALPFGLADRYLP